MPEHENHTGEAEGQGEAVYSGPQDEPAESEGGETEGMAEPDEGTDPPAS